MRDKISKQLLIIVAGLVILTSGTAAVLVSQSDNKKAEPTSSQQEKAQQPAANPNLVAYDGVEGKNALELLKEKATVGTKDTSYGPMVETINGVTATDGHYWAFYVNGAYATVGADAYQTKVGDKIEWKLE